MLTLLLLSIAEAFFLCAAQTLLKIALEAMPPFSWTGHFFFLLLTNWWLLACGISFLCAGLLWMYLLKHFPFSQVYPLTSLAFVFGMIAAMIVFKEHVSALQWVGIVLIMAGCYCVAQ